MIWGLTAGISYGVFGAYSGKLTKLDQKGFLLTAIFISMHLSTPLAIIDIG